MRCCGSDNDRRLFRQMTSDGATSARLGLRMGLGLRLGLP